MAASDLYLFVSHVSEDRAAALEVVEELERRGIQCWIAPRDVKPGKPFDDEIVEAIEGSRAMLLIFSDRCSDSEYIRREVTVAGESHKTVIPFRIEDVQPRRGLRVRLSDLHWIDGFASRERAVDQVIRTFGPSAAAPRLEETEAPRKAPPAGQAEAASINESSPPTRNVHAPQMTVLTRETSQPPEKRHWLVPLLVAATASILVALTVTFWQSMTFHPKPAPSVSAPPSASLTPAPPVLTSPSASPTPASPVPAPASRPPTVVGESCTSTPGIASTLRYCASSVLAPQAGNYYVVGNLFDGNLATAWVKGTPGSGVGESIVVEFSGMRTVKSISIANGYQKSAEVFRNNSRVRRLRIVSSNGESRRLDLVDQMGMQRASFDQPLKGTWLQFVIESVFSGSRYPDDTALSELTIDSDAAQ